MSEKAVYITYARRDRPFVLQLVRELSAAGVTVYYDGNVLKTGDAWETNLRGAINRADSVIAIISERSENSTGLRNEIEYALSHQKTVLPVILDRSYNLLQQLGLSDIYASKIETMADYAKVIDDIVNMTHPSISAMETMLRKRGVSEDAVTAYMTFARPSYHAPDSGLVLHYDTDLELSDMMKIENAVNDLAHIVIQQVQAFQQHRSQLSEQKLFHVHSVTRPNSTTLLLELLETAQQVISSPLVQGILLGVTTNLIYDVGKNRVIQFANRRGGLFSKKSESAPTEEVEEGLAVSLPKAVQTQIQKAVEDIVTASLSEGRPGALYTIIVGGVYIAVLEDTTTSQPQLQETTPRLNYLEQLAKRAEYYKSLDLR